MLKYCEKCEKKVETHIVTKDETLKVKELTVSVTSDIYVCNECGNELWDDEKDDQNLKRAFDAYRTQKHLLTSDEIKAIRNTYGVSQKLFSTILGLGEKTVTRYENGSLQDAAQNSLLLLMKDPRNFKVLWEKVKNELPESENLKIQTQLTTLAQVSAMFFSNQSTFTTEKREGNVIHYNFKQLEEM